MGNLTQAAITWRKAETQRPQLTVTLGFDVMHRSGVAAFLQMVDVWVRLQERYSEVHKHESFKRLSVQ